MADTTTELEVLNQIVDVLGGQSGQYETVVPTLQQILALLGGGGGGGGYNPSLSVGRADALTGADSTAQWSQRVTEGSGSATVRSVQGNTQKLVQYRAANGGTNGVYNGITFSKDASTGAITIGGTATADATISIGAMTIAQNIRGHKYLVKGAVPSGGSGTTYFAGPASNKIDYGDGGIWTSNFNLATNLVIVVKEGATVPQATLYPQLFDLTAMYGEGNEPSTVEAFNADYPFDYYPYSTGSLLPVQIAGIASTDAQGGELDSIEWTAQTLWGVGNTRDELTSDAVLHRIRTLVLDGTETDIRGYTYTGGNAKGYAIVDVLAVDETRPDFVSSVPFQMWGPDTWCWLGITSKTVYLLWPQDNLPYATVDDFRAWLASLNANGTPLTFAYVTSQATTTPISPALPMTYRVQQGGSESIIVPEGEISAAPILTVAEGESAAELVMDALACIATPDGPTATANHAQNTYLTMGGKLYRVTRAIAVGESIVAGTNVTETTVMAELLALAN